MYKAARRIQANSFKADAIVRGSERPCIGVQQQLKVVVAAFGDAIGKIEPESVTQRLVELTNDIDSQALFGWDVVCDALLNPSLT